MDEKIKNRSTKVLKISGIVVTVIICIVSLILILIPVSIFLAYIYEVDDDEKITEFADGSVCENTGGGTYDHRLFDGYYVYRNDNMFQNRLCHNDKKLKIPEEYQDGLIYRYSFDPDGYIAYRYIDKWAKPDEPESYLYMWDDEYIIADCAVLYDCNADEVKVFETLPELCDYCANNGINLGVWYNSYGYCCYQEEVHIEKDNWTLTETVYDYSVVSLENEELFAGLIDSYFETENGFGFHFQHVERCDASFHPNPVITYSENEVVGKKYAGLIFFYDDVYADKYVFVDTQTNKYIVFDTKKEIKEYAKTLGINPDWVKINLDGAG